MRYRMIALLFSIALFMAALLMAFLFYSFIWTKNDITSASNAPYAFAYIKTQNYQLHAKVNGTITTIHALPNQHIKQNSPLVTLDDFYHSKKLQIAENALKKLNNEVDKIFFRQQRYDEIQNEELYAFLHKPSHETFLTNFFYKLPVPKIEKAEETFQDQAQAHKEVKDIEDKVSYMSLREALKRDVQIEQYYLDASKIVAPITGRIDKIFVNEQQFVTKATPLLSIIDDDFYILAYFTKQQIGKIYYLKPIDVIIPKKDTMLLKAYVEEIAQEPETLANGQEYYAARLVLTNSQKAKIDSDFLNSFSIDTKVNLAFEEDNSIINDEEINPVKEWDAYY